MAHCVEKGCFSGPFYVSGSADRRARLSHFIDNTLPFGDDAHAPPVWGEGAASTLRVVSPR